MNGIILAAGRGARLNCAAVKPKCLFEVGESTLLQRQIQCLHASRINNIVVVIGFEGHLIRRECPDGISFIENQHFDETSSLYSLWLARDYIKDGFVVLNSDVLFHPKILQDLLSSEYEDALLVGLNDQAHQSLGAEEMKVKLSGDIVIDITKEMDPLEAHGENVGIVKFGATGAQVLTGIIDDLIARGCAKEWAPRAFREYASHFPLRAVSTRSYPWIEIDFPEDYRRATEEIYPKIQSSLNHDSS